MMYANLIFDLDETLFDFKKGEQLSLEQLFTNHGLTNLDELVAAFRQLNHQVWLAIQAGGDRDALMNTRFAKLLAEFGEVVDGPAMQREYHQYLNDQAFVFDGALDLLATLRAHHGLIVAGTNGSTAVQTKRLAKAGLTPYFDAVYTSETIGVNKPDGQFFQYIMQQHPEMTPENTVMIGDGLLPDIHGAQQAGLPTIWVNLYDQPNNTAYQSDYTVTSYAALAKLLIN